MLCKGDCKRVLTMAQEKRGYCDWCWLVGKVHDSNFHKVCDIVPCPNCKKEEGVQPAVCQSKIIYTCVLCENVWEVMRESPSITHIKQGEIR